MSLSKLFQNAKMFVVIFMLFLIAYLGLFGPLYAKKSHLTHHF